MIIIGIILGAFGIGFFCWLVFALAVYALRPSKEAEIVALPQGWGGC